MGRCGKSVKKKRRVVHTRAESLAKPQKGKSKARIDTSADFIQLESDIEGFEDQADTDQEDYIANCETGENSDSEIVAQFEELRSGILATKYGAPPKLYGAQALRARQSRERKKARKLKNRESFESNPNGCSMMEYAAKMGRFVVASVAPAPTDDADAGAGARGDGDGRACRLRLWVPRGGGSGRGGAELRVLRLAEAFGLVRDDSPPPAASAAAAAAPRPTAGREDSQCLPGRAKRPRTEASSDSDDGAGSDADGLADGGGSGGGGSSSGSGSGGDDDGEREGGVELVLVCSDESRVPKPKELQRLLLALGDPRDVKSIAGPETAWAASPRERRKEFAAAAAGRRRRPSRGNSGKTPPSKPRAAPLPPPPPPAAEPDYGPVAARLMARMGYRAGKGLGRAEDGMVHPIEAERRPRKAGLGAR